MKESFIVYYNGHMILTTEETYLSIKESTPNIIRKVTDEELREWVEREKEREKQFSLKNQSGGFSNLLNIQN
jgi:hypothetical protein